MSKGTILYVGGFELPDKNAAAHRVLSNGKAMRELGYDVVFVDVDKTLRFDTDISTTLRNIQGFDCWSVPYPEKIKDWLSFLTCISFIKIIENKYKDIKAITAYNYPSIALYNLKKYSAKHDIKILADCTEWYSTKGTNFLFMLIKGIDSFLRMRIIQKRLDGLIVISTYLENYYKNNRNVLRVPPLVDINEAKWDVYQRNTTNDKLKFSYSGSPGKNKDKINKLVEVLYSLKEYKNYELKIIGLTVDGYLDYYPEHKEMLLALGNRIVFMGRLSHQKSIDEVKQSDFSIFIRERNRLTNAGFPTKFVESISCGIPVITTKTSDLEMYLLDDFNGFYLDEDISESISKIKEILQLTRDEVSRLKINCVNSLEFNFKSYVGNFDDFFKKIM
ncbi:glycosyltransferase [Cellulosilyticum sp. I15G10I2]|uniref:glycosyltransferase n=1 Tax=Cellulosilyticum sp. I15G10I2 TaxID=1892843 RepID=UPI00085C6C33|nr:glycosyltransferase [Cellulosilyticum sp. I15G10I2]